MGLSLQQIPQATWLPHVHVCVVLEQHGVIWHVVVHVGLAVELLLCVAAVDSILHACHLQVGRGSGMRHKQSSWGKLHAHRQQPHHLPRVFAEHSAACKAGSTAG